jgi:putative intracellular protease/amidase
MMRKYGTRRWRSILTSFNTAGPPQGWVSDGKGARRPDDGAGLTLLDLAGPAEIFRTAQRFGVDIELRYIGPAPAIGSSVGIALAGIAPLPESVPDGSILVIPGATDSLNDYKRPEAQAAIAWLARVVTAEHTLCAVCSAAFLAARAGLLDGRQCTTHFSLQQRLARETPSLTVLPDRLFVRDGNVITSAGTASGIDIALDLLSRLHGPALAAKVAELLVTYFHRDAEDPQLSPWIANRAHEDRRLGRHPRQDPGPASRAAPGPGACRRHARIQRIPAGLGRIVAHALARRRLRLADQRGEFDEAFSRYRPRSRSDRLRPWRPGTSLSA